MKTILITGSGGREHAVGKSIKDNNPSVKLFFANGNGGTNQIGTNLQLGSTDEIVAFAKEHKIDLTIVGSEDLLMNGIVDKFKSQELTIFGPHKEAALLEGSKAFGKGFMTKHKIKTASYQIVNNLNDALNLIASNQNYPIVIKASGLAAGKGVKIAFTSEEARQSIYQMMKKKIFGEAGTTLVIEEFLEGYEVSVLSFYNGKNITPFISAKDHKQLLEHNKGPNTGGMGVIAPHPLTDQGWWDEFNQSILLKTQIGLEKDKLQFSGVIFFGLLCTSKGIYLLEYNLRLGDPETQTILPLLKSNLLNHIEDAIQGNPLKLDWSSKHSCCVVLCAEGYPKVYQKGDLISGLEHTNCTHFIAGAQAKNNQLLTSGGRVINIVGIGDSATQAREITYSNVDRVKFENQYYRKDIGIA